MVADASRRPSGLKATPQTSVSWLNGARISCALGGVPEPHGAIAAGRGEDATIGRERQPCHSGRVTTEGETSLAGGDVPESHRPVGGTPGGSNGTAVGTVSHGPDNRRVPTKGPDQPPCVGIPEPHGLVLAGGGKAMAVRAVRHAPDRGRMSCEGRGALCPVAVSQILMVPSSPAGGEGVAIRSVSDGQDR